MAVCPYMIGHFTTHFPFMSAISATASSTTAVGSVHNHLFSHIHIQLSISATAHLFRHARVIREFHFQERDRPQNHPFSCETRTFEISLNLLYILEGNWKSFRCKRRHVLLMDTCHFESAFPSRFVLHDIQWKLWILTPPKRTSLSKGDSFPRVCLCWQTLNSLLSTNWKLNCAFSGMYSPTQNLLYTFNGWSPLSIPS